MVLLYWNPVIQQRKIVATQGASRRAVEVACTLRREEVGKRPQVNKEIRQKSKGLLNTMIQGHI